MKARRMVFPMQYHYFALLSEKAEIALILSQKWSKVDFWKNFGEFGFCKIRP